MKKLMIPFFVALFLFASGCEVPSVTPEDSQEQENENESEQNEQENENESDQNEQNDESEE